MMLNTNGDLLLQKFLPKEVSLETLVGLVGNTWN